MKAIAALCLAVCFFHQISGHKHDGRTYSKRSVQELNAPAAVDCKMSPWTKWSTCDPCSKRMFRSRSVEAFGQFKGFPCNQRLGDRKACKTDAACEEAQPPCSSTEFRCDSGACIKKRLLCNGDNDCGDFSDEDTCEEVKRRPCGKLELELSELGRTAGYGINVLGSDPRNNAFNNELFNGLCTRVRDTNTLEYHRVPWNVATLNYATLADETFSKEIFDDATSLVKEMLQESKSSMGVEFSFKFSPTEESVNETSPESLKMKYGDKKDVSIKAISEYSTVKNRSFMRVKGKVQLSTFRMRSREPMLTETFLDDVSYLPVEYSKGEYFRFLEDYGTHYAMSGKSGGEYELVYVLNKETMKTKQMTEEKIQRCLNLDTSIDFIGNAEGVKINKDDCNDVSTSQDGSENKNALIDRVVTSVSGGTVAPAATLKTKIEKTGVLDVDAYVAWAKSLADAPVLLHSHPDPIQSLIPLNAPNADVKKENLEKATEDYVAEYSVCKCQPCQNGGTVTLIDGQCLCLCAPQFEGVACQMAKSDLLKGDVVQEGNWNCWSAWSSCNGGQWSRTRTCNTNGLTGATCKGDTKSTDNC